MAEFLNPDDFTKYMLRKLSPLPIPVEVTEPLLIELSYGDDEPVLSIPLKTAYEAYRQEPSELDALLEPYVLEIGWTAQKPRFAARDIFENTVPVMKDLLLEPIAQDGETVSLEDKEVVLRLPKGPVLFQELVNRPEEHLVVQYLLEKDHNLVELARGDVLTCFPEPSQIAGIAMQNLARRAVDSGLTTRGFRVENFLTPITLVGFRDESLSKYVASLVNVSDVMAVLEKNLEGQAGMLAIIPTREQLLVTVDVEEQAIGEMGVLASYLKAEAVKAKTDNAVSSLVWRFKGGELTSLQTVRIEDM